MEENINLSREEKSDNPSVEPNVDAKLLSDSLHLLQVFPEEIWLKILENAKSNDDLENLNNASPFLRKLLLPNRVLFLFGKVWNKLAPRFDKIATKDILLDDSDAESVTTQYDDDYSVVSDSDAGSNSSWESYEEEKVVWFKRILKMRKVCQAWCSGIDQFYQNLPQHYEMKEQLPNELKKRPTFIDDKEQLGQWALGKFIFDEDSPEKIEEFLKHFEASHSSVENGRSPYFVRDIVIQTKHHEQGRTRIDNILLKYGHHIWHCKLNLEDNYPSRLLCYNRLRFLLKLMPNLRVLKIRYERNTSEVREANGRSRVVEDYPSPEENEQILKEMETNGLPNFEHLKFLEAKNLPVPIFNELLKTNGHISMLQANREGVLEQYDIHNVPMPMPNLSKLCMEYYTKADFEKLNSSEVNWPLTSLYLDFEECPFFEWSEIFRVLENKWGNQLTELMINLPQTKVKEEENQIMRNCSKYELKLENVKRLRLLISNYTNLDFILPLKNLETLDVTIRCDFDQWSKSELAKQVKRDQKIIIVDYLISQGESKNKKQQQTNIWKMMPKLKTYKFLITYERWNGRIWDLVSGERFPESKKEWLKEKVKAEKKKIAMQNLFKMWKNNM